jgi:predicted transcriptional regulator
MTHRSGHRGRGGQGGHEPRTRVRTRELRATELAILGWPQHRIATELGISQAAVSKILARVDRRVLRELAEKRERYKVQHLMRLEHQYAELMHAWQQSKTDTTRRRQRKTQGGDGSTEGTVAELVVENQHGDARYMEGARRALADIRKILGLDAPQQLDVRATPNQFEGLSEDALSEEIAKRARLLGIADVTTLTPTITTEVVTVEPAIVTPATPQAETDK